MNEVQIQTSTASKDSSGGAVKYLIQTTIPYSGNQLARTKLPEERVTPPYETKSTSSKTQKPDECRKMSCVGAGQLNKIYVNVCMYQLRNTCIVPGRITIWIVANSLSKSPAVNCNS